MTQPPIYKKEHAAKHVASRQPRWWQFLRRNKLTEAKAKASLRAENQINTGKALWDVPTRLVVIGTALAAAGAMASYVGSFPVDGVPVSQQIAAMATQLQAIPGGKYLADALSYVAASTGGTIGATASGLVGDRYKARRKALLEQAKNLAEQRKRDEQRQRGVDVDTDPYEQIHALKTENATLKDQLAELAQWKASVDQSLRNAYASHVATNQRIDNFERRQPPPESPPPESPPTEPTPTGPRPTTPDDLLSPATSNQARNLLARVKKTKESPENMVAEQPKRSTGKHHSATPYQTQSKPGFRR